MADCNGLRSSFRPTNHYSAGEKVILTEFALKLPNHRKTTPWPDATTAI
jgi:hypothetical protein